MVSEQNKTSWLVGCGLTLIVALTFAIHNYSILFLVGAMGGALSRLSRTLNRKDVPTERRLRIRVLERKAARHQTARTTVTRGTVVAETPARETTEPKRMTRVAMVQEAPELLVLEKVERERAAPETVAREAPVQEQAAQERVVPERTVRRADLDAQEG
jgi:hypothetical protein